MSNLLAFDPVERRKAVASGAAFCGLADGLSNELETLYVRDLPLPETKARMTRGGGRCPRHGILLDFDPWKPQEHSCRLCQRAYVGRGHDDWWSMNAQLWTVERAVHAAALHALRGDERHATLSERILETLAERYEEWPNADNVLGPSRPFFSTYLESIWLINVCHALDLLERAGKRRIGDLVRSRILSPSSELIAGFPEGLSNRQVWNEVAILSAWTLLGRQRDIESRLQSGHSLPSILANGLLDDGTWYEGENYHLFAHRGLWYGVQWLRATGRSIPADSLDRFHRGFSAPFAGLLPDGTLPSRRDSPHAVSIRQWRIAEHLELGCSNKPDRKLAGLLTFLYSASAGPTDECVHAPELSLLRDTPDSSHRETPVSYRAVSTADAERHDPPSKLSRHNLSWRALLMANAAPVAGDPIPSRSVCLPPQGLSVIRRDRGRVYASLEGGTPGGGHGHPDSLALTLQTDQHRWLDDPGTGSYVEKRLHWYRSTLAHHAPLINWKSQTPVPSELLAFEDRGCAGWTRKRVRGVAPGVELIRSIVVMDGYLVDLLEWRSDHDVTVVLPIAADAVIDGDWCWAPSERKGGGGLEDGFDFLAEVETATPRQNGTTLLLTDMPGDEAFLCAGTVVHLDAVGTRAFPKVPPRPMAKSDNCEPFQAWTASAWYTSRSRFRLFRAVCPAAPLSPCAGGFDAGATEVACATEGTTAAADCYYPGKLSMRHWLEVHGSAGWITGVWSWYQKSTELTIPPATAVRPSSNFLKPSAVSAVKFGCIAESAADKADSREIATIATADGTIARHVLTNEGWHIDLFVGDKRSSIDLGSLDTAERSREQPQRETPRLGRKVGQADRNDQFVMSGSRRSSEPNGCETPISVPVLTTDRVPGLDEPLPEAVCVKLGASDYRRTEQPWSASHGPTATVLLARTAGDSLIARIAVRCGAESCGSLIRWADGEPDSMPENPLDNERSDINFAGVQWYLTGDGLVWHAAGLVVPIMKAGELESGTGARSAGARAGNAERSLVRETTLVDVQGLGGRMQTGVSQGMARLEACAWRPLTGGWEIQLVWARDTWQLPLGSVGLQLVINEAVEGRERRLGQLVLRGGSGFAYLRGDREDPARFLPLAW